MEKQPKNIGNTMICPFIIITELPVISSDIIFLSGGGLPT